MQATSIRKRPRLRLAAAFGAIAAAAVVLSASPAAAHHPEITASVACADDGFFLVSFTSTAWANDTPEGRGNPDIRISAIVDGGAPVEKAAGSYSAPSFSFSGDFTVPSSATSVAVTAYAAGSWDTGAEGGQTTSTGPLSLPSDCNPPGGEGCTPGYWKNHTASWAGTGYSPGQSAGSVFTVPGSYGLGSKTLVKTLDGGGGSGTVGAAKILLRAGTAALLNASSGGVDYTMSAADVISDVNAALASGNRDTMLGLASSLDADNNLGCPLN